MALSPSAQANARLTAFGELCSKSVGLADAFAAEAAKRPTPQGTVEHAQQRLDIIEALCARSPTFCALLKRKERHYLMSNGDSQSPPSASASAPTSALIDDPIKWRDHEIEISVADVPPGGIGAIYVGIAPAPKCLEGSPLASNAKAFRLTHIVLPNGPAPFELVQMFFGARPVAPGAAIMLFQTTPFYGDTAEVGEVISIYLQNTDAVPRTFTGKLIGQQRLTDAPQTALAACVDDCHASVSRRVWTTGKNEVATVLIVCAAAFKPEVLRLSFLPLTPSFWRRFAQGVRALLGAPPISNGVLLRVSVWRGADGVGTVENVLPCPKTYAIEDFNGNAPTTGRLPEIKSLQPDDRIEIKVRLTRPGRLHVALFGLSPRST